MNESTIISATYDYRLVALSVLIAICASYAALDLAERVTGAQKSARMAWLFGGAIAMGTGIWSMHYTGMLAYRLPMPVYYHVPTVILSMVAAICASFVALFIVSRPRISALHIVAGSLLMAGGISAMHYTGMAAMRLQAMRAVVMGFAIPAMHYTAMAAVSYTSMTEELDLTYALDISALANTAIITVTFVILGAVLVLHRRTAKKTQLKTADAQA